MRHKRPYQPNPVQVILWVIIFIAVAVEFIHPSSTGQMFK